MNETLILQLLLEVLANAQNIATALANAKSSGVDISSTQLDDISAQFDVLKAKLDAARAAGN